MQVKPSFSFVTPQTGTNGRPDAGRAANGPPPRPTLPPCATPFSNFSLDYRRSDARNVEKWICSGQGVIKSEAAIDYLRRALHAAPDYADMFNLALLLSEVVGTRKRRSTGGNILPTMLNLNGQHAHVDP